MFRFFGKLFGLVEDEFHHIVSDFQSAIDRLKNLAERQQDLANQKLNEIADANIVRKNAQAEAERAAATAAKLIAIIS